jgi:dolichyl-phosphate beta-glucosyltransferase
MADPLLSIIVPAYNEAATILRTLSSIQAYLDARHYQYELIVSADGTDGTRELATEKAAGDARLVVIGSAGRGGKGKGIRNGVRLAKGTIIGFVDADYKTPIEEIEKLLPWLDRGYPVVIGSRAVGDARVEVPQPLYRQIGSRGFGFAMHRIVGLKNISDTQCGFKFFDRAVAVDLFGRQRIDGYMFDVEILALAEQSGYPIKEVGVRWRDDGDSRLDLVAGNWRNMVDLFRIRFAAGTAAQPALASLSDRVKIEE